MHHFPKGCSEFFVAGCLALCGSLISATPSGAETFTITPDSDWHSVLNGNGLRPGDEVVLRAGTYRDRRRLELRHQGKPGQPVLIRAATGERVVFHRPDARQNSFNLTGCSHLVLRGIEITGGASGVRIQSLENQTTVAIVLEDLHIHHIGGVAVTCNHQDSRYERMVFRRNHIHHTSGHGEGFYLGGNHASAIFASSTVEQNYIHDLNGPNISQGDGIEIKHGSHGNLIRGNVIHDTKYPGITVYGTQGNDRNKIQGNVIWNTGDHGIQAAADAIIEGNWIANAGGAGIYSRSHQGAVPANLSIHRNLVIAHSNPAIRMIGRPPSDGTIELIENRLFAGANALAIRLEELDKVQLRGNVGRGDVQGISPSEDAFRETQWNTQWKPSPKDNPFWPNLPPGLWKSKFRITSTIRSDNENNSR